MQNVFALIHTNSPPPVGAEPTSSKGSTTNVSSDGSDAHELSRASPSISAAYAIHGNAAGSRKGFLAVGIARGAGSIGAPPRAALKADLGAILNQRIEYLITGKSGIYAVQLAKNSLGLRPGPSSQR